MNYTSILAHIHLLWAWMQAPGVILVDGDNNTAVDFSGVQKKATGETGLELAKEKPTDRDLKEE